MNGKERGIRAGEKGQGRRFFFHCRRDRPFFSSFKFRPRFFFSLTPSFSLSLSFPLSLSPPALNQTQNRPKKKKKSATNAKHVFYLSAEFLMGRSLTNAVGNLKLEDAYGEAVKVRRVCFPL